MPYARSAQAIVYQNASFVEHWLEANEVPYAMLLDAQPSTHPVQQAVSDPAQINGLFDGISYYKGSSILHMARSFLGDRVFLAGLREYLAQHAYGNVHTADLWLALNATWHTMDPTGAQDVAAIMGAWTLQAGLPVVQVVADPQTGRATIAQQRFLDLGSESGAQAGVGTTQTAWPIPFTYTTASLGAHSMQLWLHPSAGSLATLAYNASTQGWLLGNVGRGGFYRALYGLDNWSALAASLAAAAARAPAAQWPFGPVDRGGLLDDAFALTQAGMLGIDTAMSMTTFLGAERSVGVWRIALRWLGAVGDVLEFTPAYGAYQRYLRALLAPVVDELGWLDAGSDEQRMLRSSILVLATHVGLPAAVSNATAMFAAYRADPVHAQVPVNLRRAVFRAGIERGGLAQWDFLWSIYRTAASPSLQRACLDALAQTREPWLLVRLAWASLNASLVRPQDLPIVLTSIGSTAIGSSVAWGFVRDRWQHLRALYGGGTFLLGSILTGATSRLQTVVDADTAAAFFASVNVTTTSAANDAQRAVDAIRERAAWLARNLASLSAWLERPH